MPPRKTNQDNDVVYARVSATLKHGGKRVGVKAGEPWAADDPLVQQYPESFVGNVPAVRSTVDPRGYREYSSVERATRAPGEKRATRRPDTVQHAEDTAGDE